MLGRVALKLREQNQFLKSQVAQIKTTLTELTKTQRLRTLELRRPNKPVEHSADTELMQAIEGAKTLQKEAQSYKLRLNDEALQAVTEMTDEVKYLKQQLQAVSKDHRALKGITAKQQLGIQAINAAENRSQHELLQQELVATRERFAQLKMKLAQETQTSSQEHRRYLEANLKVKSRAEAQPRSRSRNAAKPKLQEEVKVSDTLAKQAEVLEKALRTAEKQTEEHISQAEARLKELTCAANKNTALLTSRDQELKLRDLKIRELKVKVESMSQAYNAALKRDEERLAQEKIEREQLYMSMMKSKSNPHHKFKPSLMNSSSSPLEEPN